MSREQQHMLKLMMVVRFTDLQIVGERIVHFHALIRILLTKIGFCNDHMQLK